MLRNDSLDEARTIPSPEVLEKPARRHFSLEYKAKILAEADAATQRGTLGELLRREGTLLVPFGDLAETTRRGRQGRAEAQATWSQGKAQEPLGRRSGPTATREPPPEESTPTGGVDHRRSKKSLRDVETFP